MIKSPLYHEYITDFFVLKEAQCQIAIDLIKSDLYLNLNRWYISKINQKIKIYHSKSSRITNKSWLNHLYIMIISLIFLVFKETQGQIAIGLIKSDLYWNLNRWYISKINQKIKIYHSKSSRITKKSWLNQIYT